MSESDSGRRAKDAFPLGGCLPTREQELLLRAALLPGGECRRAFAEWKTLANLDHVDPGSYRLFPLLYMNLVANGIDDPYLNIFKWVYDVTLENNGRRFAALSRLLVKLDGLGMEAALLKGTALAVEYYDDYGLRPMLDADILVPTRRAREAVEILTGLGWSSSITPLKGFSNMDALARLGWEPETRKLSEYSDEYFTVRHGQDLVNQDEFTIDLHWHVLHGYNPPDADAPFWEAARRVTVEGAPALVLDPADQLLQVCAHGMRWDPTPPVRWVADAAVILRKEGEGLNWGRLVAAARRHGVVLPVREALRYLASYPGVGVSDDALRELDAIPTGRAERFEYAVRTSPPGIKDGLVELGFLWSSYGKGNVDSGFIRRLFGFPGFLTRVFGMGSVRHLAVYSGYELVRRTKEMAGLKRK
ncbi:MAG: nucleotidyltransferase family protein [Candidatus Dadabacteria bacterium]